MAKSVIGLKELRGNAERYIERVKRGDSFIVVRRSRPVFKISSPEEESELWETVLDFTKIKKGGIPLREVLARI